MSDVVSSCRRGWVGVGANRFAPVSAPLRGALPGRRFGFGLGGGGWQAFGMSMDNELQKHYAMLLGIGSPWEVKTVELKLQEKKVEIELGWQRVVPPNARNAGGERSIHDSAPERTWRHLDTMQFTTLIRARTPRAECPEHGVKTMTVPWAVPQGRFTLLFERFAVDVLLACASVSQACELLGIACPTEDHWQALAQILRLDSTFLKS